VSLRPAIIFTVLFAILLPVYVFTARKAVEPNAAQERKESLLRLDSVDAIALTRGSESLKFQKAADHKRFEVVQPPNAFIPQDLITATVSLLLNQKQVDVVAQNLNDLAQFGLDHPTTVMTIDAPGRKQPLKIFFGSENPTHTAIYAQIEGIPKVFLLGRNLEYYQTLMFQWVEGKQGKNA
jgi:Domain of unknown function (DUF4340)